MNVESELNLYSHVDFLSTNQMNPGGKDLNAKSKNIPTKAKKRKGRGKAVSISVFIFFQLIKYLIICVFDIFSFNS